MKIIYGNKFIEVKECTSFYSRLKGFMFKKDINYSLLFNRCNSIHTFFMRENIDVIMCDSNNTIIKYYRNLGKNKIIWPQKKVRKVFETPSKYFNINIGERMIIE